LKGVAKVETLLMNSTLDCLSYEKTAYNKALLTNISENKCVKPNSVETKIVGKKSMFFFFFLLDHGSIGEEGVWSFLTLKLAFAFKHFSYFVEKR
jgi:hypothetical protein